MNSNILVSDIFICKAFNQILADSSTEIEGRLGRQARLAIATYLTRLPFEDKLDPAVMANRITEFCQRSGNENLYAWLGEVYDRLDQDGIGKLVKKTGDPGEEADAPPEEDSKILNNEGRDICQSLQQWADEAIAQSNQGNQNASQP